MAAVAAYISQKLPREAPVMFGLHPNAEIGYLTSTGDDMLHALLSMSPALVVLIMPPGAAASSRPSGDGLSACIESLLERLPPTFDMLDLQARADAGPLRGDNAPFVLVCLQECESMSVLLAEVRRSLEELRKGLNGTLDVSEPMEDLMAALTINQVPGRNPFHKCSWERLAWASRRSLQSWFIDLLRRCRQLTQWSEQFVTPLSVWLPGLMNPMAFLTAVTQTSARVRGLPLDKMTIRVHVTTMMRPEEISAYPSTGMYVHGLFLEGAAWDSGSELSGPSLPQRINGAPVAGALTDARLKQLLFPMPVLYLEPESVQPSWLPSAVGYLRMDPDVYECPIYVTTMRGPTYICLATLRTRQGAKKWTLAGAALILSED